MNNIASPVQVKDEPGVFIGDVFHAATDSSEAEEIDIENLQLLAPKFAASSKFPVGCKVWYNLRRSLETKHLEANCAYIAEVFIHFENGRRVYKVKSETSNRHEKTLYEDQLVYAIGCPVKVTKVDTDVALDGVVVYLKDSDGKRQQVTYAVQYSVDNYVTVEPGVPADRIKYRVEDCGVGDDGKEGKMSINEETTFIQEGDTDKEEKGDEDLSQHNSSAESFAQVKTNEVEDLSNSFVWEPPTPSLQRNRSSGSESNVNRPPTKVAKREVRSEVRGEVKRDRSKAKEENADVVRMLTIPSWWINQWGEENRRQLYCKSFRLRRNVSKPIALTFYFHYSSSDW